MIYFLKRSRQEKSYRENFLERFGFGRPFESGAIWIHAVSLGEFRASVSLINALLARAEKILITTITPAGREEALKTFKKEVANGEVCVRYLPLEFKFAFYQFFKRYKPRFGIILEIELWPMLIACSCNVGVPLVYAQAQYVKKTFDRDAKYLKIRGSLLKGFDLILAKSDLHASRFKKFSNSPIFIMGELRFEQKIPRNQLEKASILKKTIIKGVPRVCFCFGSIGSAENRELIKVMQYLSTQAPKHGVPRPFYIYVPRQKKDFLLVKELLSNSGLSFRSRSEIFNQNLEISPELSSVISDADGLLGDSLGEINFYFSLADKIFIGNSFNSLGCHNIIEPLALRKPVIVGPSVWGIEYPFVEALEKGIIEQVKTPELLQENLLNYIIESDLEVKNNEAMINFHLEHSGAVGKVLKKLIEFGFLK